MFWVNFEGWELEGARTLQQKCSHCSNTTDHVVCVHPKGFQLGTVFRKKPLIGKRQYFLACPTCSFIAKELTKEQAMAMKGGG
jgi:hypothetical protein